MYGIRWDSIEVREVLTLPVQDTCSGYLFRIPAHDVGVPDLVDRCSDQQSDHTPNAIGVGVHPY